MLAHMIFVLKLINHCVVLFFFIEMERLHKLENDLKQDNLEDSVISS